MFNEKMILNSCLVFWLNNKMFILFVLIAWELYKNAFRIYTEYLTDINKAGVVRSATAFNDRSVQGSTIPKMIHMTYFDLKRIPQKVFENLKTYADDYQVMLYDDQDGEQLIQKYFTDDVLTAFKNASGAHKADLLRYCILYVHGGIYLDVKTKLVYPLNQIFTNQAPLITVKDIVGFTGTDKVYNGIIASVPKHPFFIQLIYNYLNVPSWVRRLDYHVFLKQFWLLLEMDKTNVYLFQHECNTNPEQCGGQLDRYGWCCRIYDKNKHIFDTRWSDFPWK